MTVATAKFKGIPWGVAAKSIKFPTTGLVCRFTYIYRTGFVDARGIRGYGGHHLLLPSLNYTLIRLKNYKEQKKVSTAIAKAAGLCY